MAVWSTITRKLASAGMIPRTRLALTTAYMAGTEAILFLLEWLFQLAGSTQTAASIAGWTTFLGFLLFILILILAIRWFRTHVMWSVRNRLIVTYLFIGALPVGLMAVMTFGAGWLVMQHLATFLTVSEIRGQEQRLTAANLAAIEEMQRHAGIPGQIAAMDDSFPGRRILVMQQTAVPSWLKPGFTGLVFDHGEICLRAANSLETSHGPSMVVSTVPFNQHLLGRVASKLGALTLEQIGSRQGNVSAGVVPEPKRHFDWEFRFGGLIQSTNWETGESEPNLFLSGGTRLSTVLSNLSESMSIWSAGIGLLLVASAIAFAIVVLVALMIGMRLTRKITYSVANLYKATQHINRGDFTHRIQVREKDQLAALQVSFNSMTTNLERLIVEQKEKERLQSELEIAHEVQAQLFPQDIAGTSTLELYGVCRPARIVSGDYYDFLSYGPDQVGIAVGDISGKGISAALLMATIHSAVRAYEQEQLLSVGAIAAYGTTSRVAAIEAHVAPPSPAQMLWLLNRHLFQSTQPEKYATLFLGFYDDLKRRLTYSNAGHLPPIVIAADGSVRRLETGGTVVGLFNDCVYEEETVELFPGDIFIAFSDGITEPENEFGEFGEERLIEVIAANRHLPLERITEHAVSAIQDWIGSTEQPDDITLVLARRI
ncbi:MAG TPA: PP2C family protein-serine/threonine phosphatase [Candidatus Angelobacter sp.]|nr:PP2C family protein-serine/threonine phosphatase [Candidatus Angelobacter sp.]